MTLEVRVSVQAEQDADGIYDWLAQRSQEGADRWYQAFLSTLRSLPIRAAGCGIAEEAESLAVDLRQTLFKTRRGHSYRILFIIREETIHILSVRGAGQDFLGQSSVEIPE